MPLFKKQKPKQDFKKVDPSKVEFEEEEYDDEEEDEDPQRQEIQELKKIVKRQEKELVDIKDEPKEEWVIKQIPVQTTEVLYNRRTKEELNIFQALAHLLNKTE